MPECFFAGLPGAGECDGPLRVCHLIKKQVITREAFTREHRQRYASDAAACGALARLVTDERCWVPGCGGPMGNAGHHGAFKPDGPRGIPRALLPAGLEEFAAELGLGWYLDRTFGERTG